MKITFNTVAELEQFFNWCYETKSLKQVVKQSKDEDKEEFTFGLGDFPVLELSDEEPKKTKVKRVKPTRKYTQPYGSAFDRAKEKALLFIQKRIIFDRTDIGLSTYWQPKFEEWVKEQNVEIQKIRMFIFGRHKVQYVPYYYENGVKILATESRLRDKDTIKGAAAKPVRKQKSSEDQEEVYNVPAYR